MILWLLTQTQLMKAKWGKKITVIVIVTDNTITKILITVKRCAFDPSIVGAGYLDILRTYQAEIKALGKPTGGCGAV